MKTALFLLVLLLCGQDLLFAQVAEGRYKVTMNADDVHHNNFAMRCDNLFMVYFKYENSKNAVTVWRIDGIADHKNYETIFYFPANKTLSKFLIYARRNWYETYIWTISRCNGYTGQTDSVNVTSPCYTGRHKDFIPHWFSVFRITVQPDALVIQTENPQDILLPTEDPVKILATTGFPASVYNWQFNVDGTTTWRAFPSKFQGLQTQELTAPQLLEGSGLNVADYIGENVLIRLSACGGNVVSGTITLKIVKSPPNIFDGGGIGSGGGSGSGGGGGGITVTHPKCSDSNDGKAAITFDKALVVGESLVLNLYRCTTKGIIDQSKDMLEVGQTINSLEANQPYIFPKELGANDYYFKYNGEYTRTNPNKPIGSNIKFSNIFHVVAPSPVAFTHTKVNVWCHNGNDGSITVNASGGNGSYHYMIKEKEQSDTEWKPFSSASLIHTITGLKAADWLFQIRDGNNCYAKEFNGNTTSREVKIEQPTHRLVNNLVIKTNPLGYGRADGTITVDVSGGTSNAGTYNYQWTNLAGAVITDNITANVSGTEYRIVISKLPDGTYTLTTTDSHHAQATNKGGCTDVDSYILIQPPPLVATVTIKDSILCHGDANGSLVAHGKGGVPRTSGLPYTYTWKKKKGAIYVVIPNQTYNKIIQTDSTIANLSVGDYAVSIKDANNIVMKDTLFSLPEPTRLEVNVTSTPVSCDGLPNGTATAIASGGTPAYIYTWSNGKTTTTIDGLLAETYLIYVKDYRLCETQKNIAVSQPNAIRLSVDRRDPTCHNSRDGSLAVTITGGQAPYRYTWTGATSTGPTAINLGSGNYPLKIMDNNNCTVLSNYTLNNPPPLPLNLGKDRFICSTQSITYDITIPDKIITYQWGSNNGFSGSNTRVALTREGTYYAGVTDANGCNSKDTVVLTVQNTVINNEFALPTQVYQREQIVVVNTSNPQPDSLKWVLPSQAVITQQNNKYAAFTLANTGAYFVKLIVYRGRCYAEETKKVIVLTPHNLNSIGVAPEPFIQTFTAVPNPNNGNFLVRVVLKSRADIQLRLINTASSHTIVSQLLSGSDSYSIPVNVSVNPGVYVVVVNTPNGNASLKLIIF